MDTNSALLLIIISALVGSMLFFAATVAPTVFRTLPANAAGLFLRAFFPLYYLWGLVLAIASVALAATANWYVTAACAAAALLFIYAKQILMPKINRARDDQGADKPGAGERFKALHFRSVAINVIQIVVLIAVATNLVLTS